MAASKVIATDKNMFSVGIKVCIIASIDVILMFLGNDRKGFCKKHVFKNFAKITEKHMCRGLFLTKIQAGGLQLYCKVTPVLLFFLVNPVKVLKTLILETSVNGCF